MSPHFFDNEKQEDQALESLHLDSVPTDPGSIKLPASVLSVPLVLLIITLGLIFWTDANLTFLSPVVC